MTDDQRHDEPAPGAQILHDFGQADERGAAARSSQIK